MSIVYYAEVEVDSCIYLFIYLLSPGKISTTTLDLKANSEDVTGVQTSSYI